MSILQLKYLLKEFVEDAYKSSLIFQNAKVVRNLKKIMHYFKLLKNTV